MTQETTNDKMLIVIQHLQKLEDKRGEMVRLIQDLELLAQQLEHTATNMTPEDRRVFAELELELNSDCERLYSMGVWELSAKVEQMRADNRDGELAPFGVLPSAGGKERA